MIIFCILIRTLRHVLGQKKIDHFWRGDGGDGEGMHVALYDRTELCLKKSLTFVLENIKKLVTFEVEAGGWTAYR